MIPSYLKKNIFALLQKTYKYTVLNYADEEKNILNYERNRKIYLIAKEITKMYSIMKEIQVLRSMADILFFNFSNILSILSFYGYLVENIVANK